MLDEFKDNKNLVRMSPFLVATAIGKNPQESVLFLQKMIKVYQDNN